jgi:hypothetical protein
MFQLHKGYTSDDNDNIITYGSDSESDIDDINFVDLY